MGRRAVLQRIQQEAKFLLRLFGRDLERIEHLFLHIGTVDTHRAAAHFPAVEHHVVAFGNALLGGGDHVVFVAVLGCGERVVHGHPAVRLFVVLEHREVHHPQRRPAVVKQAVFLAKRTVANLDAQGADGIVDNFFLVGAKKQQVAILGTGTLQDFCQRRIVQILDHRALQAIAALGHIIDLDPGQALGTVNLDEFTIVVNFTAGDLGAARHAKRHHAAALGGGRRGKHLEIDIGHHIGEFGEFELDAQVGLVRTITARRFLVCHDRELAQVDPERVLEHGFDHALENIPDFFLVEERGFNIDLGKFRLAIGAQVFVAEAFGDLVVAVKAGHHQQLLEQLRALRQGEEVAIMDAAGHQVVARAFRRALGEHGRFNIDKTVGIEKLAHFHGHAVAQHQVVLHVGAAQVQHPVRQARGLAEVFLIELERRCDGRVEHFKFVAQHLDLAALEVGVDGALRACPHQALDLDAEFVAQVFGHAKHLGAIRVAHHLHITLAVTDIDKNHTAMVTPTVDPATQRHGLPHQGFGDQSTIMSTHCHKTAF